jgi:hypothetical protein
MILQNFVGAGKSAEIKLVLDSHTTTNKIVDYKKGIWTSAISTTF